LLVQRELAHRLPEGRRFGHPHALWVVAKLLDAVLDLAPSRDARPAAHVDVGAELHPSVVVRPGAVVLAGACVGERTIIGENAVVYGRVRIGAGTLIGPLAVIGRQGFGFTNGPNGEALRVPHVGGVIVEDEVEIGALATVDAGTLRPTVIRRGAKLDAHVHVAHNVEIGPGAYVAAQAGFAGSSRIGARVLVGGQAGVKDHAEVGDGARVGGKSGVIGDVAPGDVVAGFPAVPKARWLRAWAALLQEKKRTR
jgi:UDP-3-O-[3-hydroxymyristoyl] glucosamine N-acyltransferase